MKVSAPAHNSGILSLGEPVAWLRNSFEKNPESRNTSVKASPPPPHSMVLRMKLSPSQDTSLSQGRLLNIMGLDEVANACLRGFSAPLGLSFTTHPAVKRINWSLGLWVLQGSERTLDSSEGHRKTLNAFQATGESLGIRSLSSTLCPMGGHLTCLYHRVCCEEQRRECLWDWSVNRMYHKCNAHSTKTWLYHPAMLTAGSCLRTQLSLASLCSALMLTGASELQWSSHAARR